MNRWPPQGREGDEGCSVGSMGSADRGGEVKNLHGANAKKKKKKIRSRRKKNEQRLGGKEKKRGGKGASERPQRPPNTTGGGGKKEQGGVHHDGKPFSPPYRGGKETVAACLSSAPEKGTWMTLPRPDEGSASRGRARRGGKSHFPIGQKQTLFQKYEEWTGPI